MSTQSRIAAESHKDPRQLEREIDGTRADIDEVLRALESRLSPGELFERAFGYVRGHGREFGDNLVSTVTSQPVPALMASIGLLWMMAGRDHPRPHAADGPNIRAKAEDMRHRAGERLHEVRERAHDAGDRLRDAGHRARAGFDDIMREQPLAAGAMGIAVGVLLGALLPSTQAEARMFGDVSDAARRHADPEATPRRSGTQDRQTSSRHAAPPAP